MLDKRSETWITCHETLLRRRLVILFNPFFIFLLQTKKKTTTTNQNSKGIRESFFSFLSTTYGSINSKTKRTSYTENKKKKNGTFCLQTFPFGPEFFLCVCVCAFFMYLYLVNTHTKSG